MEQIWKTLAGEIEISIIGNDETGYTSLLAERINGNFKERVRLELNGEGAGWVAKTLRKAARFARG